MRLKRKHLLRFLLYALIGLISVTLWVVLLRPAPISVEVGQVTRGNLRVTVNEEGKTRVRDRYVVSTPITGRLHRIQFEPGDTVHAGALVAQIDPLPTDTEVKTAQAHLRELQAQRSGVETQRPKQAALTQAEARIRTAQAIQRQAEAKVAQAEAALAQAQRDRQRAEELAAAGATSRQAKETAELAETTRARELETAQREVDAAIAEVTAAQQTYALLQAEQRDPDYLLKVYDAQIAATQADLANLADEAARTEIRSPVTGKVLRVLEESARYVEAGTQLLELGNTTGLELVIDVLSNDAVNIQPGDRVIIEQWGGTQPLQATVRYVEPA
ncbi:MAG TPA: HlyD family efflux transporter periplasmic adaptor subunit, partial [Allocoleopsis sp.]